MYNLYFQILKEPGHWRQLTCRDSLFTLSTCPLKNRYEDLWSHNNYVVYVLKGRKIWHTAHGSFDLREGSCVFVRKGAAIVEQFFDADFCFFLFFFPDEFICDVLKSKSEPIQPRKEQYNPVISIDNNLTVQAFFQSMMPYFDAGREPDPSLLELKFRELILTIADNPVNGELISYFCSLLKEPRSTSLMRVMDDNYCFNLTLDAFAKLANRSLSAFKRDFEKIYGMPPGKWLMEKRLNHALHLLTNMGKTVSEAAFESGFESPAHFSRSFRQRFGASPLEMKKQPAG